MVLNKHILQSKKTILVVAFSCISLLSFSQLLTSSPYSRYGLGEINAQSYAQSMAMGGSFIAYHQDTLAPFFINVANPAGLAGMKLTTLELGGQSQFTTISSSSTSIKKKNTNFSYGSLAFPIRKINGGAAFGINPYSSVGYKISSVDHNTSVGDIKYNFQGNGGINKAFIGLGVKPFQNRIIKFMRSTLADSLLKNHLTSTYKRKKFGRELLSELSLGATGNYLFGTINQETSIIYPGSITYFNSKRQRIIQVSDFTFNYGLQTHFTIDSVKYHGNDTLKKGHRKALRRKIKVGTGFYVNTPALINAKQSSIIYNYSIDGFGQERPKDTVLNSQNNAGTIKLPLEFGAGLSIKKGENLLFLLDGALIKWSEFKLFDASSSNLKNSYRVSAGLSYLPSKLAYGASNYLKRVQYRIGFTYSDGYLDLNNSGIQNYALTAGLGLPVGIGRFDDIAVVNISAQYGKLGTTTNNLLQEDYIRLIVGFTFNKKWFIKYKYD